MTRNKSFFISKKFLVIAALAFVAIISGIIFWNRFKYKFVHKKIDTLVTGKSGGLYQLTYQDLRIDEAAGNISAENLVLSPDSSVYQAMKADSSAPGNLFYIEIPQLHITGVRTPRALLQKEIKAGKILVSGATVEIMLGKKKKKEGPDLTEVMNPGMYRQLLGKLNSIEADSIVFENTRLKLADLDSKKILYNFEGLSIRFASLQVDSSTANDSSRILFSKNLALSCKRFELPLKNKFYNIVVHDFDFNYMAATIRANHVKLTPTLSETEFAKAHKYAVDRINLDIGSLELKNIDRAAVMQLQIVAETLLINNASLHDFRDKSVPHDSVDRTDRYPQQSIANMSIPIQIGKTIISDSYIEYKEKNEKSDSSGRVSFYHVNATLDNITNMPHYLKKNDQLKLVFQASFLDQAPFHAEIQTRISKTEGNFRLQASLGAMHGVMLNPLVQPMALAKVDEGEIRGLHYRMSATNTRATGKLTFLYDGLNVKLLKKDEQKNKYKTKVLPTLAAGIAIKKSNPQNGQTRTVDVDYKRDIYRSIFNLMWKSLFSGVKKTVI